MKKTITIFIILIILVLPVYSADVYASINLSVYGEKRISGYASTEDTLIYEALVSIPDHDVIDPSQVKASGIPFQRCDPLLNSEFLCIYEGSIANVVPATYDITVDLFDNLGNKVSSATSPLTFDVSAPQVFISSAVQVENKISVSYVITDDACAGCVGCSGLDKLVFRDGATVLFEKNLSISDCSYSDSTFVDIPINTNTITIDAFDRLGNRGTSTFREIGIDEFDPVIQTNSFNILKDGFKISDYIGFGTQKIVFSINVKEENLEYLEFDLREFNAGIVRADCVKEEWSDINICKTAPIEIRISDEKAYDLVVHAKDVVGRSDSASITKNFKIDNNPGTVISITTPYVFQENSYIGAVGADIKMLITDEGSGFNRGEVYLDLKDLNPLYSNAVKADSCSLVSSGIWQCVWYNKSTSKSVDFVSVFVNNFVSRDDAGNNLVGRLEERLKVDNDKPVITEEPIIKGIGAVGDPADYLSSRGLIGVFFELEDATPITAKADFSSLITSIGMDNVKGECFEQASKWNCVWEVGRLRDGYHQDLKIDFVFKDIIGNTLEHSITGLEIYPRDDVLDPDYWSIKSINPMPQSQNRAVTSLFEGRQVYSLELDSGGSVIPLSFSLRSCSGAEAYFRNFYLVNDHVGSTNPMIFFELEKFDSVGLDYLDFSCELDIISLIPYRREKRVSNIETKTLDLKINFYDVPFGELGSAVQNHINSKKDTYIDGPFYKTVGQLNKLFSMASKICTMMYTMRSLLQLRESIRRITSIAKWKTNNAFIPGLLGGDPQSKRKCYSVESFQTKTDNFLDFAEPMCNWINCKCKPEREGAQLKNARGFIGNTCGISGKADYNFLGSREITNRFLKTGASPMPILDDIPSAEDSPPVTPSEPPLTDRGTFNIQNVQREFSNPTGYMNVRDNLILSLLPPPCLPGIIYNAEKYRQIQCMHIICVQNSVFTGASVSACSQISSYLKCKYIIGEIFNAIPIVAFWTQQVSLMRSALSDPLSTLGLYMAFSRNCVQTCTRAGSPAGEAIRASCVVPKMVAQIGEAIANIRTRIDPWDLKQRLGQDYCDLVE